MSEKKREILFRGKENPSGEWIEGFLVGNCHIGDWVTATPVHGKTVGQFTGLTDKNGTKIFEGDIVDASNEWWNAYGPAGHSSPFLVVEFDENFCGFTPFANNDCDCGVYICSGGCEIIGNIHDNPELLKEEPNV